jgi:transcription elongation factor Elf1
MPIAFNCEHCGKQIKAPDAAAGKNGVCPSCKGRCAVPMPKPADDDEIRVAPLDETDEERRKRLEDEDRRIRESIWGEREEPEDPNERFKKRPPKDG